MAKKALSHLDKLIKAHHEEQAAINRAIDAGKAIFIDTAFGRCRLLYVTADWWYKVDGRSFMGCNDSQWDSILEQAGVQRVPVE